MKKLTLLTIFLISILNNCYSQDYIYIGSSRYKSTPTWEIGNQLSVNFGRSSSSTGIIMLETSESQFRREYFGATLVLYLKNGRVVTLTNRLARDRVNGYISAAWSVNPTYLSILKSADIAKIRYSLIDEFGRVDNYSVINEIVEEKRIKAPVPEAESMTEIERMQRNIQSEYMGSSLFNERSIIYYYRYETLRIPKGWIRTSEDIKMLY